MMIVVAVAETNANQREQFIRSTNRVLGRDPTHEELADFNARQHERAFIAAHFGERGGHPHSIPRAPEPTPVGQDSGARTSGPRNFAHRMPPAGRRGPLNHFL